MINSDNKYIYCYISFIPNINTFIMSKRDITAKYLTDYPNEMTISVKLKKKIMILFAKMKKKFLI